MRGSIFAIFIVLGLTLSACGGSGANQQPDPTEPPPAPDGVIQGTILSASGDPVVDAQVVLQQVNLAVSALSAQAVGLGTTDSAGQFGVDVPSAGTYSLVMVQNGLGVHTTVDVVEQAGSLTSSELDLTATAVGAVEGHVVYPDGSDAVNVLVFLEGASFLALTDATGDFVISGVPAGSYTLTAKEDSYASAGISVTVTSGTTVSLAVDVALSSSASVPVITAITPSGPQAVERSWYAVGTPITITGSGFGDAKNNSLLLYNGTDVSTTDIVSWSDTEIITTWARIPYGSYVELNEARYEIATTTGSAVSFPVVFYEILLYGETISTSEARISFSASAGGSSVIGVPFDFTTSRGTLSSTSAVTSESYHYVTLTPVDLLPHFVTATSGGSSMTIPVVCCEVSSLSSTQYTPGIETELRGTVRANFYNPEIPIANATGFSFVIEKLEHDPLDGSMTELGEAFRTPITTDANGEFSVLVTLPALPSGQTYRAYLEYQTERVGYVGDLYPAP